MTSYLDGLFSLDGRVAVVTGGNSGIGRAIAEALAYAGASVVLLARDKDRLRETAEALPSAGYVAVDLADREALAAAADEAAALFGEPDILVNSAGVNPRPPLAELTLADWDLLFAVNLDAPFLLGQRFGPGMAERGWGRIINLASQQSVRAFANSGGYGASKAGLTGLTRSQAEAWSRYGVCCNAIAPGVVETPMNQVFFADPARPAAAAARTMTGRNGLTSDFAGLAVFLASPACEYVTGQTIFVDGGFSVA
ncbi:SDR family NAD(P)-dependent oxidoreductase [Planosporangium mesophilum]|uniref:Gluconate 5-dehydrogenase n=1 Tax=Planosporangium mesophilum TaxID=689768 RepID=A0A8J3T8Z9_9ACTN|nr:SDR family oxidoreductase [Planosporangium mesophilum]NJC81096.1 SDR family oxidoreductase [Planosporangium mesophilum]GII21256.1 gluconate 5-dehydrogenase [Planosporangium mesophilum]